MTRVATAIPERAEEAASGGSVENDQQLLIVGPLPPPMSGTHVTFQILCEETRRMAGAENVDVIDTSQKQLKKNTRIASLGNLRQAVSIVRQFRAKLGNADVVLVFGSNGFLASMAPILVWLARRSRKPIYLRAFGGSLDQFIDRVNPLMRRLLRWTLRNADGLSVQTALLHKHFRSMLSNRVGVAPGFRRLPAQQEASWKLGAAEGLHIVFVGIVREDKGIFVLLDALRQLRHEGSKIQCDIYGPLWPQSAERFNQRLPLAENVSYKGVLHPDDVIATIEHYDALVLPTFYQGEGHPGVIIEAMMAGVPVVTTDFRSIPELVQHEVNGLIVPPKDADALANTLLRVDREPALLKNMAQRHWELRQQYGVSRVVPEILRQMGVQSTTQRGSSAEMTNRSKNHTIRQS